VHAVDQIDVHGAGMAIESPDTMGMTAAEGPRCSVARAGIGLGFSDNRRYETIAVTAYDALAKEGSCNLHGGPLEEGLLKPRAAAADLRCRL